MSPKTARVNVEGVVSADFDVFFREVYPSARALAERMVGSVTEAEDLAAEALYRALLRWERVRDLEYREAWVMRVTANLAFDMMRRRKRDSRPLSEIGRGDVDPETRLMVVSSLARLPRRQREAVVLRHLGGFAPPAVAEVLGLSVNTVKRHLQRGLDALRIDLSENP